MTTRPRPLVCVPILALCLLVPPSRAVAQEGRPPTLDDLLAIEELGAISLSPDGRFAAVVVRRARTAGESYQRDRLGHHTRADVWLASTEGGAVRNLTHGMEDRSGFWNPVWSPDGRYLAMLSTRGADNVRPWIWDRETDDLRPLGEAGVETRSNVRLRVGWPTEPLAWIDGSTLLLHLLDEGQTPWDYHSWLGATEVARRAWPLAASGTGVTSSVLESGDGIKGPMRTRGAIALLDVRTGRRTTLAEGLFWHVLPSPDRRRIALVEHYGWEAPGGGEPLEPFLRRLRTRLGIVDLAGQDPETTWIADALEPAVDLGGTIRYAWSPDGDHLTVPDQTGQVHLLEVASGRLRSLPPGVASIAWSGAGALLYRSAGTEGGWRASLPFSEGSTEGWERALPPSSGAVAEWWTGYDGTALGVANGRLVAWTHTDADEVRILAGDRGAEITALAWPNPDTGRGRPARDLVVALSSEGTPRYAHVRLGAGAPGLLAFEAPSPNASLRGFHPETGGAVFRVAGAGTYAVHLGRVAPRAEIREIVRLNPHMDSVGAPERRLIEYTGPDGERLLADLLLPYHYDESRRYPLVVRVYGGSRVTAARDPADGLGSVFLNHHLLAARGFAVLEPSMPLGSDPMLDMTGGVIPAVDRVVELGIADPDRVALLGQSFGGYSVYSLITQTDRFAAAIGLAGMTNLSSLYGSLYFSMRYGDWQYQWIEFANSLEYGQIGLGGPPWAEAERYVRNSPVFAADRVTTPLLILHGDLDHVPMAQADELFTALYRLGKRARYVRYWGETHVIQSPANLRDMWSHITAWLDEHIGTATRDE